MYQKPEDVRLFGSRIMNESQRMLTLIDTIMHLSKVEETETTITWKTVSVDSLVRYAADLIKPQADAKGVTIDIDAQPLYTYGNPALLSELIMNLLENTTTRAAIFPCALHRKARTSLLFPYRITA